MNSKEKNQIIYDNIFAETTHEANSLTIDKIHDEMHRLIARLDAFKKVVARKILEERKGKV